MGASLLLILMAISHKVEFGGTVLLTLDLPEFILNCLSGIRASGRMFWPVIYLIILASIIAILIRFGPRKTALLIAVTLAIQVIDFFPWYNRVNQTMAALSTSIGDFQINIASAGIYLGNQSIIEINGVGLSPNKGGFNIVIVNPENGKTLIYNYDTFRKNWDYKFPEKQTTIKTNKCNKCEHPKDE